MKETADAGFVIAMFNYALFVKRFDGFSTNWNQAVKYFKMAADKGHVEAKKYYDEMMSKK